VPAKAAIIIGGLLLLTRRLKSRRVYAGIDWSLLLMFIVPMHCTGEPFYEMLKAELPKKVIRLYTGTKLLFGA
jgi:metal-dependent hydrolase (beta-lactamase superfamily II)